MDILPLDDDSSLFSASSTASVRAAPAARNAIGRTRRCGYATALPACGAKPTSHGRSMRTAQARSAACALRQRSPCVPLSMSPRTARRPPLCSLLLQHPPGRRDAKLLPAIAALFDVLEAVEWRVGEAAEVIGATSAAITRLLQVDDRIWRAAAERRQALHAERPVQDHRTHPLRMADGECLGEVGAIRVAIDVHWSADAEAVEDPREIIGRRAGAEAVGRPPELPSPRCPCRARPTSSPRVLSS